MSKNTLSSSELAQRAKRDAELQKQFPDLVARAKAAAQTARTGQKKTIRIDRKTTVEGIVLGYEFERLRVNGRHVEVLFTITMECGSAKAVRKFSVARIDL